LIHKST